MLYLIGLVLIISIACLAGLVLGYRYFYHQTKKLKELLESVYDSQNRQSKTTVNAIEKKVFFNLTESGVMLTVNGNALGFLPRNGDVIVIKRSGPIRAGVKYPLHKNLQSNGCGSYVLSALTLATIDVRYLHLEVVNVAYHFDDLNSEGKEFAITASRMQLKVTCKIFNIKSAEGQEDIPAVS